MPESQSPGEVIRQMLKERDWTQADLAMVLGRPVPAINEIISGKRGITPETARQLAIAFDNSASKWLALEAAHRLPQADADEAAIKHRKRLFEIAPIKDLQRRGWIGESHTVDDLEHELRQFFDVESLTDDRLHVTASLRSSISGELNPSQRAWCFQARKLASALSAGPFSDQSLSTGVKQLKRLAAWPERASEASSVLADCGIRFVVVEPLPRTRIDGAAFWLDDNSPVIALSLRFDRIDSFWHTLGHELSHIRHRDGESLDVDLVGENRQWAADYDANELRAESEAAGTWIDSKEMESFIVRVAPLFSRDSINRFANRLRVHPGIIVGQLQHRGQMAYGTLRDTLAKIREHVVGVALTDGWGHPNPLSRRH